MEQNGVPLVREVVVRNGRTEPLLGAVVEVEAGPGLSEPLRITVPEIAPAGEFRLSPLDLRLSPGRLRSVLEAERGEIRCRLLVGDKLAAEQRADVRILAFNEWPGKAAPAGLLAAFVLPNHPVIAALLQAVRENLTKAGGSDALDGYQGKSRDRVRDLVKATYEAVQTLGIGYVGAPPSFEVGGQKIRLPDAVLGDRLGCCLDLAALIAGVLEQMGIAPLIVLVRGHAFVAAWLTDDRFPAGVIDDAARLRTQVQLGNLLPLEATATTQREPVPFERAVAAAFAHLQDDSAFEVAVDVRALRTEYRPLPIRTVVASAEAGAIAGEPPGAAARVLARAAAEASRPPASAPPQDPATTSADRRFRKWKEKLLDLTLRNRLLHFRSEGKGALRLAVPDLELLEDGVHANRSFELLPRPDAGPHDLRDEGLAERRVQEVADVARIADLKRGVVHSRHGAEELWTRAHHLDREARTAIEEGGASVLYLAIGFLSWFESASAAEPRLAPLLLYPVDLKFDARGRRARMQRLTEDPVLNVTLVEKLRLDHAVDATGLDALPMASASDESDESVAVRELLRRFREAIQHIPRWEVLEEAHLGLFSFTKFLMWKDLDENADQFLQNPVVRRIASQEAVPLQQSPSVKPEETDRIHPSDLPTVLSADSTQLAAIASSLDGQSFVLQGPPGTGKSQTIANLIAANLARQRSVLFVSEKMAALDVVHRRLRDAGLGDFCLELHSHKANKKEVVASLKSALEHASGSAEPDWKSRGDMLVNARRHLDDYATALHKQGSLGCSVYQARNRLTELTPVADEPLAKDFVQALTAEEFGKHRQALDEFAAVATGVEPVAEHPFFQARCASWSGVGEEELRDALAQARSDLTSWSVAKHGLAGLLGVEGFTSAQVEGVAAAVPVLSLPLVPPQAATGEWPAASARARRYLRARAQAEATRQDVAGRWSTSTFELDAQALLTKFNRWKDAFFLFAWVMLWSPRRQLRVHARGDVPGNTQIVLDLQAIQALRASRAGLEADGAWVAGLMGGPGEGEAARWLAALDLLDGGHAALMRLAQEGGASAGAVQALLSSPSADRRKQLLSAGQAVGEAAAALRHSEAALSALLALAPGSLPAWEDPSHPEGTTAAVVRWESGLKTYRGWCLYRAAAEALAPELSVFAKGHLTGQRDGRSMPAAFEKAVLRRWHASAVDADRVLRDFDASMHAQRLSRFRELDRAHIENSRRYVVSALEKSLPPRSAAGVASSEPSLIVREAQKKTRHLPIRRLLREIPGILPRLKPCFLMSPLSVAQYLPADGRPFDLVVFDEASQICTHEAIGAIARGRQVVIVGDSRQMPPTSFFKRTDSEDELPDDDDVVELESVLDEAVAKLVPQQWLGWHYRSRHESLIEFSNQHIYESRLDVFPSAAFQSEDLGIEWCRVQGVYESGKDGRTNRIEAAALCAHLIARLKRFDPGDRTFGVVTFNQPQQQLILDLLDEARIDPLVDRHFAGSEGVFVKNLENVQGDERDEILFSICYAPNAAQAFRMHYGPLSLAGGERRLNVAVTRARQKLSVFCSIDPEQIDRSRTNARGAWLLREFLQHARSRGRGGPAGATATASMSPQERAMADALRGAGWQVDAAVGSSSYKLDLAVRDPKDPERYGVAVETDGPVYVAARSTRDRDRLRADVLQGMGWRLQRVWSSEWWHDPTAPRVLVEKVRAALAAQPPPPPLRAPSPDPKNSPANPAPSLPEEWLHASAPQVTSGTYASAPGLPKAEPALPVYNKLLLAVMVDPAVFYTPLAASTIQDQIERVVGFEGPIHEEVLARRVCEAWSIERLTARPTRRLGELLKNVCRTGTIRQRGEFYWPGSANPDTYSAYRTTPEGEEPARDLPQIAPEEIANLAVALLRQAGSLDRTALAREVARLFGVQRMGAKVRESLEAGLSLLVDSGRCEASGDRLRLT